MADYQRIDHVKEIYQLYWIPDGGNATDGVHVHYPADELYAILCLEPRPQNVPGTGPERSNWCCSVQYALELFTERPEVNDAIRWVASVRPARTTDRTSSDRTS